MKLKQINLSSCVLNSYNTKKNELLKFNLQSIRLSMSNTFEMLTILHSIDQGKECQSSCGS